MTIETPDSTVSSLSSVSNDRDSLTDSPCSKTDSMTSLDEHDDDGLRLRLNADGPTGDSTSPSPTSSSTSSSVTLDAHAAEADPDADASAATATTATATAIADGLKTKTKSKSRKRDKHAKSPLLDALKLPPLSEISIPVQIKFAPLHIPPHRRLQTAAVAIWALLMPICFILYFFLISIPPLWVFMIPYTIWVLYIDQAHETKGGRPKEWARRFFMWKYFAQYYPCSIVKEADLPPDRRYVFGYHPHGIIGMGAIATFATEATGFSDLYPGVKPHLLTLDSNFRLPFYRDIIMALGISSVSKRSCRNILAQGPGSAITIVVGGATESLAAHPGTHDLTLKRRFGFIKVAVQEGANLVPVFSFGENDIYEQLANEKGSNVYKLQKAFQKIFGWTLPLFHGRGIFNYNYGLMPFRHPIVSVIGKPIEVTQSANPTSEELQAIQKQYIDGLVEIWEKYKDIYAKNRTRELTLVE